MRRFPLDEQAARSWLQDAYLHPNANWYTPVFDVRRRSFMYLTSRHLLAVDEPGLRITAALDRTLRRLERGDPTIREVRRMSDEDRLRHVVEFIASREDAAERDRLFLHFAKRSSIVFHWRPGALLDLTPWSETGEETAHARAWNEYLDRVCEVHVDLAIMLYGIDKRPVFAVT